MGDISAQTVHRRLVALCSHRVQGEQVGQVVALQALVGFEKRMHLAHGVEQDVAVAVATADQLGKGVVPSEAVTVRTLSAAC